MMRGLPFIKPFDELPIRTSCRFQTLAVTNCPIEFEFLPQYYAANISQAVKHSSHPFRRFLLSLAPPFRSSPVNHSLHVFAV